jgi:hypothetical protein
MRLDDIDVRAIPAEQLRRRIGFVPRTGGLLPHWTVLCNVAVVRPAARRADMVAVMRAGARRRSDRWPRCGALPATLIAVVVDLALGLVERAVTPAFLHRSRGAHGA